MPWCSVIPTCRSTGRGPTASRSSTRAARPTVGAPRTTRWASPAPAAAPSPSSSSHSTDQRSFQTPHARQPHARSCETTSNLAVVMDLDVFFAGTAGSVPTARRGMPALLVRRGGDRLLFDCGEGTQRQLVRSTGLPELDDVFLSHFHADHWLGLPGMLKTFDLRGRERPLTVHGPPGLGELMRLLRPVVGRG